VAKMMLEVPEEFNGMVAALRDVMETVMTQFQRGQTGGSVTTATRSRRAAMWRSTPAVVSPRASPGPTAAHRRGAATRRSAPRDRLFAAGRVVDSAAWSPRPTRRPPSPPRPAPCGSVHPGPPSRSP